MNKRKRRVTAASARNDMRAVAKEAGLKGKAADRFVRATAGKSIRETNSGRRKSKGAGKGRRGGAAIRANRVRRSR